MPNEAPGRNPASVSGKRRRGQRTIFAVAIIGALFVVWTVLDYGVVKLYTTLAESFTLHRFVNYIDPIWDWRWFILGFPFVLALLIALVFLGRTTKRGVLAAFAALVLFGIGRIAAAATILAVPHDFTEPLPMSESSFNIVNGVSFVALILAFVVGLAIARRQTAATWLGLIVVVPLLIGVSLVQVVPLYAIPFTGGHPDMSGFWGGQLAVSNGLLFASLAIVGALIGACSAILWACDEFALRRRPAVAGYPPNSPGTVTNPNVSVSSSTPRKPVPALALCTAAAALLVSVVGAIVLSATSRGEVTHDSAVETVRGYAIGTRIGEQVESVECPQFSSAVGTKFDCKVQLGDGSTIVVHARISDRGGLIASVPVARP